MQIKATYYFFLLFAILGSAAVGWLVYLDIVLPELGNPAAHLATGSTAQLSPIHYVGSNQCKVCHQQEYALWKNSHHDLAMQVANVDSVLGDFNDSEFRYFDATSKFLIREDKFIVRTDGPDGRLQDFEIKYTFGVDPLQQYIIEFPGGRFQVLSIAWDTRDKEQGGQRWFHLYPEHNINHDHILHWTGINQNWNYMCAECHSTDLKKNYDTASDTYQTEWAELNVACEACHGPGSEHIDWTGKNADTGNSTNKGLLINLNEREGVHWEMDAKTGHAVRSRYRKTATEIQMCARCHARRGILSENYVHGKPLLDTHRLSLLDAALYYPDGQIKEEVYVLGSFLQSKMYHEGVTCSDCHEPHSLKLRSAGNGICLNCHSAAKFNTARHHFHDEASAGARCVECHMPETLFMRVDPRRDHSIRIPRPDLTQKLAVPNACNQCHKDKNSTWAANWFTGWYGSDVTSFQLYAKVFAAASQQQINAQPLLTELAVNPYAPAIARASALSMFQMPYNEAMLQAIRAGLQAEDHLIRMAAVNASIVLNPRLRWQLSSPALIDSIRSVRLAAARVLADIPIEQLPPAQQQSFLQAADDYLASLQVNADRPEAQMNLGVYFTARGLYPEAETAYRRALNLQPSLPQAYVNLADIYRQQGQESKGERLLRGALTLNENAADIHHALGLSLIRQQQSAAALQAFAQAAKLAPENARYVYVYAVALQNSGKSQQAIAELLAVNRRHPANRDIIYALIAFNQERGNLAEATKFARKLLQLDPNDRQARQLLMQAQDLEH